MNFIKFTNSVGETEYLRCDQILHIESDSHMGSKIFYGRGATHYYSAQETQKELMEQMPQGLTVRNG